MRNEEDIEGEVKLEAEGRGLESRRQGERKGRWVEEKGGLKKWK